MYFFIVQNSIMVYWLTGLSWSKDIWGLIFVYGEREHVVWRGSHCVCMYVNNS